MTEEDVETYGCECPKCAHKWKIPVSEWTKLSLATGWTPRCPKCNSGRVFWKRQKMGKV